MMKTHTLFFISLFFTIHLVANEMYLYDVFFSKQAPIFPLAFGDLKGNHCSDSIPPPEGDKEQYFCLPLKGEKRFTIADIEVNTTISGAEILWYETNSNTSTVLPIETNLIDGRTYYAFQMKSDFAQSLPVKIIINPITESPDGEGVQYFCSSDNPTISDIFVNKGEGCVLGLFHFDENGVNLPPTTPLEDGKTYYLARNYDMNTPCVESLEVKVLFRSEIEPPVGDLNQKIYKGSLTPTLEYASISNTNGYTNLYWYDKEGSLVPVNTEIKNGDVYTVTQSNQSCAKSLEISFEVVEVNIIPAPIGDSFISVCEGSTISDVSSSIENTPGFDKLFWFEDKDKTQPVFSNNVILEGASTYYVAQENIPEAEVLSVTISVEKPVPAPIGENKQYFCKNSNVTLQNLDVKCTEGYDAIYWYDENDNLIEHTHPLEDGKVYKASQVLDSYCDYDQHLQIEVHLRDLIPSPTGYSPQYFCKSTSPKVTDLEVNWAQNCCGGIYFFNNKDLSESLPLDSKLENGKTYYITHSKVSCCDTLAIEVKFVDKIEAPIGESTQIFLESKKHTLADATVSNTTDYHSIYWYDKDYNLVKSTTVVNNEDLYYAAQGQGTKTSCIEYLEVSFSVLSDSDSDTVADIDEDINQDKDLTNDDTDSDGIPNYLDDDDDGDGVLTINEDANGDGDPTNDDVNNNGIADYLEEGVALSITDIGGIDVKIYPNPVKDLIYIDIANDRLISVELWNSNGQRILTKIVKPNDNISTINISEFTRGIYILKLNYTKDIKKYKRVILE